MSRASNSSGEKRESNQSRDERTSERVCPECESTIDRRDAKRFELVCDSCGLVVEEFGIDHGPEWRAWDARERAQKSRVGAPTTKSLHDEGLSSRIDWQDEDAYGNTLGVRKRRRMQRLRTWDERFRTRNSKERNLKHALGEIERMASALGIAKKSARWQA